MRLVKGGAVGLLALALLASSLPVCPCAETAAEAEHACCRSGATALRPAEAGCCPTDAIAVTAAASPIHVLHEFSSCGFKFVRPLGPLPHPVAAPSLPPVVLRI